MTIWTGTDSVDLDLAHITLDIGITVAVTLTEVILDHFTSPHTIALCMPQELQHILLPLRHTTSQILITQEFVPG